nr:fluorescent protein DiLiFP570 [Diadumene lineata]
MSLIKDQMTTKLHLEGTVNGHYFEIEGNGQGEPYEGKQSMKLVVTKGAPLPFAYDILLPQHMYGSKPFIKYPAEIPDYYKQSFPEGFSWERIMKFEDGAVCTVSQHSSLKGNCFVYDVKFHGVHFPLDGPVMQKKTLGWEPSTERIYPRDGMLRGDVPMALKVEGGGNYRCDFKTVYKAKKSVKLPENHFVDHRIVMTKHDKDYTNVEQAEVAVARNSPF